MKKITLLFVTLVTIISCTSDKEIIEKETPKLLNKQVTTESYDDDGDPDTPFVESSRTSTYLYNDKHELIKIVHESPKEKEETLFTYTKGKITKIEDIDNNGETDRYSEYEYTGNLLTKQTNYNSNGEINSIENYEYNSISKILKTTKQVFFDSSNNVYVTEYEYISDNKVKEIEGDSYIVYTFDNKNSPLLNIAGIKAILNSNFEEGGIHNVTLYEEFDKDDNKLGSSKTIYKYDSDNFVIQKDDSSNDYSYIVTYEYNK
ncbi:hypothetical protein ABMY20_11815 [Tenacibaculum sp. SSH1-16]|uniref:DUF4595 domain-containing protein n=1 Tax=Tenacibaculum sp. Pbs-1 TaxID=3238748 RepID=A0AB33L2K7_9FLAO|nr:hypothetical protein [Tenacibaculum mesophilum]